MKRDNYLSWDEYFMGIAMLSGARSKDPGTQVGACIVNAANRVMGIGYNGFPRGCSDDEYPWDRSSDGEQGNKYYYVCHAELNAILNSVSIGALGGCRIYVSLFPCNECAKAIIQAGLSEVVYLKDTYADTDAVKASKRMFRSAGVQMRQMQVSRDSHTITFV